MISRIYNKQLIFLINLFIEVNLTNILSLIGVINIQINFIEKNVI